MHISSFLSLASHRNYPGIFVRKLERGSLAEENGRLLVGDRILEANGYDVRNANIDEAATRMAVSEDMIKLCSTLACTHAGETQDFIIASGVT